MKPPRIYKAKDALILRQRNLGEADRILTIYSRHFGKLDAKAKGLRRSKSRLSGHLQPLSRCSLQLVQGQTMETVIGAQGIESFPGLRDNLSRLSRALYAVELVDKLVPERTASEATYELLLNTLRRLSESNKVDHILRYFEVLLLGEAGFAPQLDQCPSCNNYFQALTNYFSPTLGGAICQECCDDKSLSPLSVDALKVMRLFQKSDWPMASRLQLDLNLQREIEQHLHAYIVFILERNVNAATFIEKIRREITVTTKGPHPSST